MAETEAELHARLNELQNELDEGEITTKGYQKRRTLLLSQFLGSPPAAPEQQKPEQQVSRGLRVHNADDTLHPASGEGSRSPSFAAKSPTLSVEKNRSFMGEGGNGYGNPEAQGQPPGGRLQIRNTGQRMSSYGAPYGHPDEAGASYESSFDHSREPTMMSANYAFNPANELDYKGAANAVSPDENGPRSSTVVDQAYFSDFAGHQQGEQRASAYGGPNRYSQTEPFSPTAAMTPPMLNNADLPPPALVSHQLPLEPREVPFAVYDPHNTNLPMSKFDNIASVLRHRARTMAKQTAYWALDPKGKEYSSIAWDKLGSRAEKVAQVIRDKSNLYRGDRVALVYRSTEIIDFAVALMGCFVAGVVAVPINELESEKKLNESDTLKRMGEMENYRKMNTILTTTQAHLALTTDANLKTFQRIITENKLSWPRGVEWWKTNEFGSYHPKKKEEAPPLAVPDLAYIEFSKAPTGDIRGVVISHRTIMHQMACLSSTIATIPNDSDTFKGGLRNTAGGLVRMGRTGETIISYLDPRQSIGMILGVFLAIYGGHTLVWLEPEAVKTSGLYAHLITKYKSTLMVANYPGLKQAAYNYQSDPMTTRQYKKNFEPNFSTVKLCMIDSLTVDSDFHEILADRWLKPLGNQRAREVVAPMLCLPEHGGMVISMRDWLGGEERMGCRLNTFEEEVVEEKKEDDKATQSGGYGSLIGSAPSKQKNTKVRTELSEVLLDKESLKTNEVVVVAIGEQAKRRAGEVGTVRVGAFGYPIPDATLAVVDPETSLLCTPNAIGEIWVDSPSLSGGFWALPKHTESIFHARPYKFVEGNPTPMPVEPEFLRTGLLGTVIDGKVYILGLYEDRLRQRVEWVEHGMETQEYRYFFVQHLIISIMKNLTKIYDASAFDVFVNDEHFPIILLESAAASTAPTTNGGPPRPLDTALLDSLSERCMEVLYQEHHLRVYCVMITAPGSLPRVVKNGREEIGNMLCRRDFDAGTMTCVHVKFGVERSVMNLPVGVDPVGGIWSPASTAARQEVLAPQDKQYSGADYREVVIDDRTSTPLNNFSSIVDLFQWRVARQAEELAYCTIDGRGREGKGITWKKFDQKVAAVAVYLQNKCKIKAGDHVVLMYTHSEEFIYAVHACFCLGVTAIPMAPLDQNRLNEDAPAFLHLTGDFKVKAVLVNTDVDHLLKQKIVSQHIKQSAAVLRVSIPPTHNTNKPSKQAHGCRELGFTVKPAWVQPGYAALVWTYWTPDQRRIAVQLGHDTIMGTCKVQKETCQMTSSRPVLGCVRSTSGLGFVHSCLMGVFVGAPTYLVSPVDFAQNPASLFLTLARYKVKDTYATSQMLDHAMSVMPGKGFTLHELKNMMISTEGRPRVDVFQKVRLHFAQTGLDRTAINTIYTHVLNPMITTRSYMCIEPIELWLDTRALRRGLIYPVDPESDPTALFIQDSGMVPVSTQITIVNPETNRLCLTGEYGEIWVQSEACVQAFYGSRDAFDAERFSGRTVDGDPHVTYVRTGDLGFMHYVTRPIGPNGQQVEMQVLFVLGSIGETFEVNGLSHFPMDIEYSVEKCHRNIVPGGCAVFQAGGLVVVLVEVMRKAYLASIVPVIVNSILNEHQLIADIVAFVGKGDFPRSRLGEKQRGKILASWVTRKMRTIAQFSIRDPDYADSSITAVPEERITEIAGPEVGVSNEGAGMQQNLSPAMGGPPVEMRDPSYAVEQELPYESSIVESPGAPEVPPKGPDRGYSLDGAAVPATGDYFPSDQSHDADDFHDAELSYFTQDQASQHDPDSTPVAPNQAQMQPHQHQQQQQQQQQQHQTPHQQQQQQQTQQYSGDLSDFKFEHAPLPPHPPRNASKPRISLGGGGGQPAAYAAADASVYAGNGYGRRGDEGYAPTPTTAIATTTTTTNTTSRNLPSDKAGYGDLQPAYTAYHPTYAASGGNSRSSSVNDPGDWPAEALLAMRARDAS